MQDVEHVAGERLMAEMRADSDEICEVMKRRCPGTAYYFFVTANILRSLMVTSESGAMRGMGNQVFRLLDPLMQSAMSHLIRKWADADRERDRSEADKS